ncbi:uncharacterized protein LOC127260273 [Andrographis paniculata]|uniref:uncharacterized protein LOC127260273 n=1 Tax=Andrographis paniculata TaxID=175694 RepID=UPI0021E75853|nr:uncharacterized protein LOC127260273 [Andrographis paniculata]
MSKDAAFCLWCYLFGEGHKHGENAFTKIGFRNWKKAIQKFKEHEGGGNNSHNYARAKCFGYKDQKHNVDYVFAQKSSEMEIAYRTWLTAVVDIIRYLLGQGLAFHGHDESSQSVHRGNFLELISWYCERNEEINSVMNSNAPANNQLSSPDIQKQIINACATEVRNVILNEIGDKYFSLLIDEARDSSVKEQMSIILRFVNDDGEVIERFLCVVYVSDTCSQSLKNAIDEFFAKNGLSLSRLRGQGYDGASNMRGEFNRLKALILKENRHARYIHCFSHQLQLVVVASVSKNGYVLHFFEYLSMIVNVAGASYKMRDNLRQQQHDARVKCIEECGVLTGKRKNQEMALARAGDTRWGSHFKTILRLFQLWDVVKKSDSGSI